MPHPSDPLAEGLLLQEKGDWAGAVAHYLKALEADPSNPHALFLAGVAQAHAGRLDLSCQLLGRCLATQPGHAEAAQALGGALLSSGKTREAAIALERAQVLNPKVATIAYYLGAAYHALGKTDQAIQSYRRATKLRPDYADAHNNLGNLLKAQNRIGEAAEAYRAAIAAQPVHKQAWYNLGITLQLQKDYPGAEKAYRTAVELDPANPNAENNLGLVLRSLGKHAEAILCFQRAIELRSDYSRAMVNLAITLQDANRTDEAIAHLKRAIQLDPADYRAHCNLGNAFVALNDLDHALEAYEEALKLNDELSDVRYNIALVHLLQGDYEKGWEGYDARLESDRHQAALTFEEPRWRKGQPLAGKRILIHAEQGIGDTLQFLRYVPLLVERGAIPVLLVQSPLKALVEAQPNSPEVVDSSAGLPPVDLQCPLLSLPHEFSTRLETIPSHHPTLVAPAEKLALWRKVFSRAPGLKVGLVWAGNPKHQYDHNRSIPLRLFTTLVEGVNAHFFSLQLDLREGEAATLASVGTITSLAPQIHDFTDTASIVAALDLVITVDTSVAHLGGALGVPTWVLVGYAPDWRWLLGRDDSPWYPSVRLFRQTKVADWQGVIDRVKEGLIQLSGSKAAFSSVPSIDYPFADKPPQA